MNAPADPKLALLQTGLQTGLQAAIAAALSGDQQAARVLLEQITSAHPQNELAWLWLASVSVTAPETMRCWRQVIQINPSQEQAVLGLKRLLLQEGIQAAKSSRPEEARELLLELTQLDANNELAWLWLAALAKDIAEATRHTLRVLEINPENERARVWIEKLRPQPVSPIAIEATPAQAAPPHLKTLSSSGWHCPFCAHEAICAAVRCPHCHAIVSLSSLDETLPSKDVNLPLLRDAVQRLTEQATAAGEQADYFTLFHLGLGYLNLSHPDEGAKYLRRASELKLKDARLKTQIESLLEKMSQSAAAATAAVTAATAPDAPLPADAPTPMPDVAGAYTILVVDDSPTIRKLVAMTLEKYGHQVLCATNGLDALNKLKEMVPDLILSDINMPQMDGYQLCKIIRGNAVTRSVPVIMLSGKDGIFDKLRGRMVGATAYITKPFEIDSLLQLIDMHCQQAQGV